MQIKKFKINILDLLIILIAGLCITGAFLRGYKAQTDEKLNNQDIVIEFKIKNIQKESEKCFTKDSPVYLEDFACDFGTLYGDVRVTKAKYYTQKTSTGEVKISYSEDGSQIDLEGAILCKGTITKEGGFKLDGSQYLAPGNVVGISILNDLPIAGAVTITDITLKSEYDERSKNPVTTEDSSESTETSFEPAESSSEPAESSFEPAATLN